MILAKIIEFVGSKFTSSISSQQLIDIFDCFSIIILKFLKQHWGGLEMEDIWKQEIV